MNIRTASDLKYWHEQLNPASVFFSRDTMKFLGDTMRNYSVRQPREIVTPCGDKVLAYELVRRHAVKHGIDRSAWFDAATLQVRHPAL